MGSREGDWICGTCQYQNFRRWESCQRCEAINQVRILPGDWYCNVINCGAHNYASRTSCYRCATPRDPCDTSSISAYDGSMGLPGWKKGDWMCPRVGCGAHNYASRTECFQCGTSRYFGG
ncbi:uncharacterized protein LOC127795534 isoform X2 [Diospyros lotus]|nr:uncharacterized protein LOC127795534 isoform X2 [Diospyros lotus]